MKGEVLSPEERVERVRMALAEAGYPDASVELENGKVILWEDEPGPKVGVPPDVGWRAAILCGEASSCWPCFSDHPVGHRPRSCDHDPLASPWPEVVR